MELIKRYPNRIFLTKERKDFFQIIKKSYFYLNTYPLCGGLMFQYVAKAGRLPITLKYDNIVDDFLLNQNSLNVIFDNEDEMFKEIDKLFSDINYKKEREKCISKSVISEKMFQKNLYSLIKYKKTNFDIHYRNIKVVDFTNIYKENISVKKICHNFFHNNRLCLFFDLPVLTIYGFCISIINKINNYFSKRGDK